MKKIGMFAAFMAFGLATVLAQNPQALKPRQVTQPQSKTLKSGNVQKTAASSTQTMAPGKAPFQPVPTEKVKAAQQSATQRDKQD